VQANHAEGSQRQCIRDEVEIARRANYDRDHGVPVALDAHNTSKQWSCGTCTTKNSYDVPSTTKTTTLPMTSTSSQWLTPHQQAQERSTTSLCSHSVFRRSDTRRTSSQPLRSMTIAPTQVYGSRCTTSQQEPLEAMKTTWRILLPCDGQGATPVARQSTSRVHHLLGNIVSPLHDQLPGDL
jgi:hypothetical protein